MAYTKIKPVKHHLQRCLDYTSNPKKTEKFSADDLNRLLSYTQNQNKTEHQLYVTGFRCNPATAYRRMYRTKKRWNQPMDEGDILAYHINNLSDFVFSAIKAIGAILLGFGIVQIGLALKGHDASQRAQGFMTFFGGVVIYFAKDILDMIL